MDSHRTQIQEYAEGIAKLIQQVPMVRGEIEAIKASNEEHKATEKVVGAICYLWGPSCAKLCLYQHRRNVGMLDQQVAASSAQLEALNARVTELVKGLQSKVTMKNVHSAVRPVLDQQTHALIEEVHECVGAGLEVMRGLIRDERNHMQAHIYSRLVGTQRLFEAVGCYLRSVRAGLASLVDNDRGKPGSS